MYPPDIIFWGVKRHDNCDNIYVNTFIDMNVSFIIDPIYSV